MLKKTHLFAMTSLVAGLTFGQTVAEVASTQKSSQEENKNTPANPVDEADIKKLSEAFGHFIGRNLNMPGVKFDLDSIIKGMRDGAEGKAPPMTDQEYEAMMATVQEKTFNYLAAENLTKANQFLKANAKNADVKEIVPEKLQYLILEEGTGPAVVEHSTPLIKYAGKYIDGTIFGNSDDVGGSITIPIDQTIPGFGKGIVGMKEGEKRRLFVHPDLGYGTTGNLPPNSLLIFDIEVVKANNEDKKTSANDNDDDDDGDDDDDDEYIPLAMNDDEYDRDLDRDEQDALHDDIDELFNEDEDSYDTRSSTPPNKSPTPKPKTSSPSK